MKLLIRILITAGLVLLISNVMSGVHVASFTTSIIVAVVLGLLKVFVKPIMVILTFPITLLTLGFFLLIINAIVILICTKIVGGFSVDSLWTALLFSIALSILESIAYKITGSDN
ncbi:phage holin family protein [Flavobacterium restrictum]|uniref:Phage holin family protein n=1 Tax=Flavobacterium restrictum TaxID=2594428 RepID=A0A553E1W9_9FLAO|nr:phage holin family protein [Flavobacterium restrictum]TRX39026.1 phage holin family protein [Flavobacterium restrictum]